MFTDVYHLGLYGYISVWFLIVGKLLKTKKLYFP